MQRRRLSDENEEGADRDWGLPAGAVLRGRDRREEETGRTRRRLGEEVVVGERGKVTRGGRVPGVAGAGSHLEVGRRRQLLRAVSKSCFKKSGEGKTTINGSPSGQTTANGHIGEEKTETQKYL